MKYWELSCCTVMTAFDMCMYICTNTPLHLHLMFVSHESPQCPGFSWVWRVFGLQSLGSVRLSWASQIRSEVLSIFISGTRRKDIDVHRWFCCCGGKKLVLTSFCSWCYINCMLLRSLRRYRAVGRFWFRGFLETTKDITTSVYHTIPGSETLPEVTVCVSVQHDVHKCGL